MSSKVDYEQLRRSVENDWDSTIVPTLSEYIKVPNQSPVFDPEWATNGLIEKAAQLLIDWVHAQAVPELSLEVVRLPGRTPLVYIEIPSTLPNASRTVDDATVLLYGHLDKQPPFEGWSDGLGPYQPVIRDGKLYGRGGADDGYAVCGAISAIRALKTQGVPHARCVVIIEACEESGSRDLPFYVEMLAPRIGRPDLVVCLDSGAGNYDQLWITTSLRGLVVGELKVRISEEGVHSGDASGIIPDSFRLARLLLDRIEDSATGKIVLDDLYVDIPEERANQAARAAAVLDHEIHSKFPFVSGARPVEGALADLVLNRTWKPALAITGAGGLPSLASAGNVLRPETTLKLSLRLPPQLDAQTAGERVKAVLEANPPYGAQVTFTVEKAGTGWAAPPLASWLETSADNASKRCYEGREACYMGEGGSIPFMGMLGKRFPGAQFCIIGVLGPHSNAHGPNEFLHIDFAKRLTCCVSLILADHAEFVSKAQQ